VKAAMENQVVYKGMKRLRYSSSAEEIKDAYHSPYKLWRDYLRISKDYWWVCQQKGDTLDAELKAMYEDFGDVYNLGFNDWWHLKGRKLFSEQVKLPAVKQVESDFSNLSPNPQNHLLVEIPLNLTERTISRQLMKILREQPKRKIKRESHAERPLAKLVGIRKKVLRTAHEIWCLNHLVQLAKKEGSNIGLPFNKMTTHQIGVGFRLVRNCMPKATDGIDAGRKKRNGMKVAVSRMLSRADSLIANAEIGKFPSFETVKPRVRWTDAQQKALDVAVAKGKWQPPDIDIEEFRKMFDKAPKVAARFTMWSD
jgi:hypothetical protein